METCKRNQCIFEGKLTLKHKGFWIFYQHQLNIGHFNMKNRFITLHCMNGFTMKLLASQHHISRNNQLDTRKMS